MNIVVGNIGRACVLEPAARRGWGGIGAAPDLVKQYLVLSRSTLAHEHILSKCAEKQIPYLAGEAGW